MVMKMDKSLIKRVLIKLKELDKKKLLDNHVVLLPDFFVDHFLTLNEFETNMLKIKEIYQQGGGNLPEIPQKITQGGNSANTALALARLGFSSHLICRTDKLGLHLLKYFLGNNGVDISCVKIDGELAITTAFEFGNKRTNVMIGDTGSVSDFSFDILDDKDKDLISKSDMICVTTWNLNNNGTELARDVFRFAKKHDIKTFFDTGDPSPRKNEIPDLFNNVLTDKNLDILGLNENELLHYSKIKSSSVEDIVNAATELKKKIHARIDLHTANFTCAIDKKCTIVPTPDINKKYRSTGAGDAWNAGDIFGEIVGLIDDERLFFASSVACFYISSLEPVHPTLNEMIKFISKYL
jgi:sugar/nucleoside kinase (ribokinase family)